MDITKTDFQTILPIWRRHLWLGRQSEIRPTSSMIPEGGYDVQIHNNYSPVFFIAKHGGEIVGTIAGHFSSDDWFRARGLFVQPDYRRMGLGAKLLETIELEAKKSGARHLWTFPRKSAWSVYQRAGFELVSDWEPGEIEENAYATKLLNVSVLHASAVQSQDKSESLERLPLGLTPNSRFL